MPQLFGSRLTRVELLRRVGRLEQVAGVRLVTLGDGQGRGVRVLEFRTGSGFAFDVLVDRAFDVGRCELGGISLAWQANAGVVGPWYYEPDGWGWLRAWGGGMVVTCGLDHTLGPGEDGAAHFNQPHIRTSVTYGLHGRIGGLPARLVGYGERWEEDECVLWAEGEVLQSAVYGEQLLLRRRIEARVGESRFSIHDEVDNVGHTDVSHMFLYHCNVGFPVVEADARLVATSTGARTDYGVPVEGHERLSAPVRNATEACFEHSLVADASGRSWAAIVNEKRAIGVYQAFPLAQLPRLTIWRSLGEGTYGCAMEPSTNRDAGRWDAIERGELQILAPGERRAYDLELGAVVGADDVRELVRRIGAVTSVEPGGRPA